MGVSGRIGVAAAFFEEMCITWKEYGKTGVVGKGGDGESMNSFVAIILFTQGAYLAAYEM